MIQTRLIPSAGGAILFDAACAAQAGSGANEAFAPDWFDPAHWRALGRADASGGGRGGVLRLDAPFGRAVLRHYRRGGLVARLLRDRYLWTGADRSRGFAEFRLLAELAARGLPVPAPIAARYVRDGAFYRADLITREIPQSATLAQLLASGRLDAATAARVGATIAAFHNAGAYHADLNAHNVLLDASTVWLIDFDRGALRTPARAWQQANLARLERSLRKLGAGAAGEAEFERSVRAPLRAAYARELALPLAARRSAA